MAAFAEFYSLRSPCNRIKLSRKWRAGTANLAINRGIRYYYGRRGRQIPRFRDFLDPHSRAWQKMEQGSDPTDPNCCTPSPSLAQLALAHSDPLNQAAPTLSTHNPVVAAVRGRSSN